MSPAGPRRPWGAPPAERIEQRISVEPDGTVVVRSGKVEFGQGVRTGFARIVSEELRVPVSRVRVELGETDRVPWDMGTFGSMSIANDGKILRAAAAAARKDLLERAVRRLGVPADRLAMEAGSIAAQDGRALTFAELTRDEPLRGEIREGPAAPAPWTDAQAPKRLEAEAIVTGRARYAADVRLPNLLRGHALHSPAAGCKLLKLDDRAARAVPGVVAVVKEGDFVGVVAERDEQALAAVRALTAEWSAPEPPAEPPADAVLRRDAGVERAFAEPARVIRAEYYVPHIAHAPIGPSAAVADVREDGADLYVSTQRPFGLREQVAETLHLAPDRVRVHPQAMGGMYGRGNVGDAAMDAVALSRAARRPVLVQWTRAEEFAMSPQRPRLQAGLQAALDASGNLVGWRSTVRTNPHTYGAGAAFPGLLEMTSGRNAVPPYQLGQAEVLLHVEPAAVRTGALRSLAAAPNVFASESFIDELAFAAGRDPIAFRLALTEDERLRHVLEIVRSRSGWEARPRQAGEGFGASCAIYHGTYVAQVAEVSVAASGKVRLERVWCAVDAGRLVLPDGAANQIEGGIQQAASWTLLEELRVEDGRPTATSWRDYSIATFQDAPQSIDVVFVPRPELPSTGLGEPGSVPTAAAIANAVFDACGARLRRLPLTAAAVRAAKA